MRIISKRVVLAQYTFFYNFWPFLGILNVSPQKLKVGTTSKYFYSIKLNAPKMTSACASFLNASFGRSTRFFTIFGHFWPFWGVFRLSWPNKSFRQLLNTLILFPASSLIRLTTFYRVSMLHFWGESFKTVLTPKWFSAPLTILRIWSVLLKNYTLGQVPNGFIRLGWMSPEW